MTPISQLTATSHQHAAIHRAGPRAAARGNSERSPGMTPDTPKGGTEAGLQDAVGRIRATVARLSAGVHAAGDERAHAMGWTVTPTARRFGLSARTYRDPRFGPPSPARPAVSDAESQPATAARERR
jgi:hypothetical protein